MRQKQLLKSCHPERSEGPQIDSSRVAKPVQSFFASLRMTGGSALALCKIEERKL
jgi:hypothetical protein